MSKGIESGEWRGERRGDIEGEQRDGRRGECVCVGETGCGRKGRRIKSSIKDPT